MGPKTGEGRADAIDTVQKHLFTWTWRFLCRQVMMNVLSCTCVGIHPGRVESASPIEWATSCTEALQAWWPGASSLGTFTQSFHHHAWQKTRGQENGSGSALIVVAHVFNWPPARLRTCEAVWEGEDPWSAHHRDVLRHYQTSGAFFARAVPVYLWGRGGDAVARMEHVAEGSRPGWMMNGECMADNLQGY